MTSYFKGRAAYLLRRAGEGVLESFLMGLHENRYNPKKETLDEAAMRYIGSKHRDRTQHPSRCIYMDAVWADGCRLYARHCGHNRWEVEEFTEKKSRVISYVNQRLLDEAVRGLTNLATYKPMEYYQSLKEDV